MPSFIKKSLRWLPHLIRPFTPFPLDKLLPQPEMEPIIYKQQQAYARYNEAVPLFLSTPRRRFINRCEVGALLLLSLATGANVYRYATKQELWFK